MYACNSGMRAVMVRGIRKAIYQHDKQRNSEAAIPLFFSPAGLTGTNGDGGDRWRREGWPFFLPPVFAKASRKCA